MKLMQTKPAAASNDTVKIVVDGRALRCRAGQTVAGALLAHGIFQFRHSPTGGMPRGPFCMMGICQECAISFEGRIQCACQVRVVRSAIINK
jgi:predicted molibdopterin-dependent oxidoreductase YjgC